MPPFWLNLLVLVFILKKIQNTQKPTQPQQQSDDIIRINIATPSSIGNVRGSSFALYCDRQMHSKSVGAQEPWLDGG